MNMQIVSTKSQHSLAGGARRGSRFLAFLFVALGALVACGGQSGPNPNPIPNPNPNPNPSTSASCCDTQHYYSCSSKSDALACASGNVGLCQRDTSQDSKCQTSSGKKTGDLCTMNEECPGSLCLFRPGDTIGYCSQACSGLFDCPFPQSNWTCDFPQNVASKACLKK